MRRVAIIASLAAGLSGVRTAHADTCRPRAIVGGDEAVVARVAAELERLGIAVERVAGVADQTVTPSTCPTVLAMVQADAAPDSVLVAVRGSAQGSEGRVVSDASMAAAWIDSWIADDAEAAGWLPDPAATAELPAVSHAPGAAPVTLPPLAEHPAAGASLMNRFAASAGYAYVTDDASNEWTGITAGVCVKWGGSCVGGRFDLTTDPERSIALTGVARRDIGLLATIARAVPIGRVNLGFEAGAGLGLVTTRRVESCTLPVPGPGPMDPTMMDPTNPDGTTTPPEPNPMDPGTTDTPAVAPGTQCMDPTGADADGSIYVGDALADTSVSPRAMVAVRVDIPLADWLWLEGRAGMSLTPLGHTGAYEPTGAFAENGVMVPTELVTLPGDPVLRGELAVGLRVGLP